MSFNFLIILIFSSRSRTQRKNKSCQVDEAGITYCVCHQSPVLIWVLHFSLVSACDIAKVKSLFDSIQEWIVSLTKYHNTKIKNLTRNISQARAYHLFCGFPRSCLKSMQIKHHVTRKHLDRIKAWEQNRIYALRFWFQECLSVPRISYIAF